MSTSQHPSIESVKSWIQDVPELEVRENNVFCRSCQSVLTVVRHAHVTQHIASEKHRGNVGEATLRGKQKHFNRDFTEFMISCNIPWTQLDNSHFRDFITKCLGGDYGDVVVPSESTLRKNYLPFVCQEVQDEVRTELREKHLWLSVDETTDACGRKWVHVIAGTLEKDRPSPSRLIASKEIEEATADVIVAAVNSALHDLWGEQYDNQGKKFLLFLTDAAAYMKKAGVLLQTQYRNLLHFTCMAHALHRVVHTIVECYPTVNALIANTKKVFLKSPKRINLFQTTLPDVALPPEPVLTRWGTWLDAVEYYHRHFDAIKLVVDGLNSEEAQAIARAKAAFNDASVKQDLTHIHTNFSQLSVAIKQLEHAGARFTDAMSIVSDVQDHLSALQGGVNERVTAKLQSVLGNNPGYYTMARVVDLFKEKEIDTSSPSVKLATIKHFMYFQYAPVTSVDVERSFSFLKWMFADRRRSLTAEHLSQILIVFYNRRRQR